MPSSILAEVQAANERYASGFAKGHLPMPPGRQFAILACMDARLDPARVLGLEASREPFWSVSCPCGRGG